MKASLLRGSPSWSRASRRHLVIQAKLRSTTHLLGSGRKPEGKSFSHSTSVPSGTSSPRSGTFRRRTIATAQPRSSLPPCDQSAAIVAIAPQQLDLGKELLDWLQQGFGSLLVGLVGAGDLN